MGHQVKKWLGEGRLKPTVVESGKEKLGFEKWLEVETQNGSLQHFMAHFCGHVSSLQ